MKGHKLYLNIRGKFIREHIFLFLNNAVWSFWIKECPSSCLCSKTSPDLALVKTDCSRNTFWVVPMGVSKDSTDVWVAENRNVSKGVVQMINALDLKSKPRLKQNNWPETLHNRLQGMTYLLEEMNTIIFTKVSTLNLASKYSFFSKISKMLYLITFQGFFRQQNCEHYKEIHGNH